MKIATKPLSHQGTKVHQGILLFYNKIGFALEYPWELFREFVTLYPHNEYPPSIQDFHLVLSNFMALLPSIENDKVSFTKKTWSEINPKHEIRNNFKILKLKFKTKAILTE